jgi:hypothetical protein
VGLTHQIVCDPPGFSLGHIYTLLLLPQKHTADANSGSDSINRCCWIEATTLDF